MKFDVIEKRTVYQGKYRVDRYRLQHEKAQGGWTDELIREVLERGHAAAILPYDPGHDRVVLVEQFRIGPLAAGRLPWTLEVPAGIVETGETPEAVARRECAEECGCEPSALEPVMTIMPSVGVMSETVALFCGRVDGDAATLFGGADAGEDIRVRVASFDEALRLLRQGEIVSAPTVVLLQWLTLNRERLRRAWG